MCSCISGLHASLQLTFCGLQCSTGELLPLGSIWKEHHCVTTSSMERSATSCFTGKELPLSVRKQVVFRVPSWNPEFDFSTATILDVLGSQDKPTQPACSECLETFLRGHASKVTQQVCAGAPAKDKERQRHYWKHSYVAAPGHLIQ